MPYVPSEIEPRWQARWAETGAFKTDSNTDKPTFYVLDMFPYPSGAGLHVGHVLGYTASDIVARYKRMKGFEVLHPMGWDAFGLPAEQYAIEKGVHPEKSTKENIDNFRHQLQGIGFSYDWDREVGTCDPSFYRWTQWIFLKLVEHDLAYQTEVPVNWCPALGTVLANDEVIDGKSERGGHEVIRKPMRQWMLRITKFADRLLEGLERIDFPESIKAMQRDRIGRSEGADARFEIDGHDAGLDIFTTRPDTMFGATFCVLAPEHDLVDVITTDDQRDAVKAYQKEAASKSDIARSGTDAGKSGVFTGAHAINPVNGDRIPIWVADYVMMSYGTGAIMCVPGHDERDWAFATKFDLPIIEVITGGDVTEAAWDGDGTAVNSGFLDGKSKAEAIAAMIDWLEDKDLGTRIVRYRLRDWIFARQRYWGEPIPIVHTDDGFHALPDGQLPLDLPVVESFAPTGTGESPLAAAEEWVNTTVPGTDTPARQETDTMPGAAGSSWYFLRFIDPANGEALCDANLAAKWMPVDLYIGGAEHAVGHLLYSRFWTKFLFDLGICPVDEPFQRLVNQGMILGPDGRKMSKRYGNVVNPLDVVAQYGADALRLYEMFLGPIEAEKPWAENGVEGVSRFLRRVWRLCYDMDDHRVEGLVDEPAGEDELRSLHRTIEKVGADAESLRFNTAISAMMVLLNDLTSAGRRSVDTVKTFMRLLAPFAPHIAEELWSRLGGEGSVGAQPFPEAEERWLTSDTIELPVQVNGKVRDKIVVPADADEETVKAAALACEKVASHIEGKEMKKFLYVPGRLVTIAVKG